MDGRKGFLSISDAPFLRFLLPYSTGVAIQYTVGGYIIPTISALVAALFLTRYYSVHTPRYKFANSKYFGYAVFAIFLFAGSLNMYFADKRTNSTPPVSAETAVARISGTPKEKEQTIQCDADILLYGKQNGEKIKSDMPSMLFFQTDTLSCLLKEGDIVIFKEKLQPIQSNDNPYGYDYSKAMRQRGYVYSQYIPSNSWEYLGHETPHKITEAARKAYGRLTEQIEGLNLRYRSEALVKAMIAGDTSQITQSIRTSYSTSGLSHILAVSGLHTGIIAYIIYLLLLPLKYIRAKRLIPFITVIATWCYIYVIGMPPSAVRAGIMATLVLIGDIIGRKETTINALLAAAFLMLLYNPYLIFDVGFQLSYTAVFSIFYLYPLLISRLPDGNGIKRRLSSIAAVTIAAQVGTLPLCIYYFHQIPLLGTVSNMIAIPFLPLIMAVALFTIFFRNWVTAYLLDTLLSWLDSLASAIGNIPFASIDDIYVKPYHVIFLMIVIFCTAWGIRTKRSEIITGISCFIFLFIAAESINMSKDKNRLTLAVYDDNDITAINMASPHYNYIITPGISKAEDEVKKMAGTFWLAGLMPDARFATDSVWDGGLSVHLPYIVFGAEKIVILDSDRFGKLTCPDKKLFVDKVIITWGFDGDLSKVCEFFDIGEVIIASNIPWYIRNKTLKECEMLRIPCYDIKREGAYIARLKFRNRR